MKVTVNYDDIMLRFQTIDHLKDLFVNNNEKYEELITKGIIIACRIANVKQNKHNVDIAFGGGANFVYSIRCYNDNLWNTSLGEVNIDFENKTFKVFLDEWRKDDFLLHAYYHGVLYNKSVELYELDKWKNEFDFVESKTLKRIKALGKDMRLVGTSKEIKEVLLDKQFIMYNKGNDYKGEVTTLNEKDVKDILHDSPLIVTNGEKVIIEYPYNVCKMVSI